MMRKHPEYHYIVEWDSAQGAPRRRFSFPQAAPQPEASHLHGEGPQVQVCDQFGKKSRGVTNL
jgi:hypothetical protein